MFKISNLDKPASGRWKFWSKFLSRSLPAYIAAVTFMPVSEDLKLWITFTLSFIVATISGLSEFTTEESTE